jgi:hypothetical protein
MQPPRRIADRRPVAVGEVDMGNRKGARDKGYVVRIELAFNPVGPDPVQVMLNDPTIDQATGVKYHAGPQQFDRFAHFGRLGKTVQPRQQGDDVGGDRAQIDVVD